MGLESFLSDGNGRRDSHNLGLSTSYKITETLLIGGGVIDSTTDSDNSESYFLGIGLWQDNLLAELVVHHSPDDKDPGIFKSSSARASLLTWISNYQLKANIYYKELEVETSEFKDYGLSSSLENKISEHFFLGGGLGLNWNKDIFRFTGGTTKTDGMDYSADISARYKLNQFQYEGNFSYTRSEFDDFSSNRSDIDLSVAYFF